MNPNIRETQPDLQKTWNACFFSPSAPQTRRRWKTKKRHDWWMQPLEVKCKTPSFCCIGGVTNGTLPSCFSLPSMTTAASRAEPWEASPGVGRISRQVRGKDNGTATLSAYNTRPATHMRVAAARIAGKAEKRTQCTMVLPRSAAIALKQTRERVAALRLLDSCGANGNVHGARCARPQPMEGCETLSCRWAQMVMLGWLPQPHRAAAAAAKLPLNTRLLVFGLLRWGF